MLLFSSGDEPSAASSLASLDSDTFHVDPACDSNDGISFVEEVTGTQDGSQDEFVDPLLDLDSIHDVSPTPDPLSVNAGYKIVFDNIDKTVKPRHMTADTQNVSLHNVHAYAVKDRVDYSRISDDRPTVGDISELQLCDLIPSSADYSLLKERFEIHVSRIITDYLKFFHEDFNRLVHMHTPHKYTAEHNRKSEVVSIIMLCCTTTNKLSNRSHLGCWIRMKLSMRTWLTFLRITKSIFRLSISDCWSQYLNRKPQMTNLTLQHCWVGIICLLLGLGRCNISAAPLSVKKTVWMGSFQWPRIGTLKLSFLKYVN